MECLINEIYACHLGEGLAVGEPATLVRFAGCNLDCIYCDTRFACDESGAPMAAAQVAEQCRAMGHANVLITGGEPLLQADACLELVTRLRESGSRVIIESNGSQPVATLAGKAELVLDVKTPGSGEGDSFLMANLAHLSPADQLKFVLLSRADYDWARAFVREYKPAITAGNILFSAAAEDLSARELSRWMLEDGLPYRFHIQAHKAIWGDSRGV